MSVVDNLKGASLFSKLALLFLTIALLFVYIAFTCTGWIENDAGQHWGLWRACSESNWVVGCVELDGTANDWWAATQALAIFGFVGINVAFFLLILYMFVGKCQKNGEVAMATAIICIVTGVLFLIGVIVFGAEYDEYYKDLGKTPNNKNNNDHSLSYSYGLAIVAVILEILSGVLLILDGKKGGGTSPA
ncbi:hypothetical protein ScPMuIL_013742 [Solemya velum]